MTQPVVQTQVADKGSLVGATLLVAGTCVGGGMLALPVETSQIGLLPSLLMMLLCWGFMTFTGLLYVEANLWMGEGAHVMTMASQLLGRFGKIIATLLYLFMAYASLIAYISGGGVIINNAFFVLTDHLLPRWQACILFATVFGALLYLGTKIIGKINALLVICMIIAYLGLVATGLSVVNLAYSLRKTWGGSLFAMPLILATFSYQMIVPSLTPYLKRDPRALRKAILLGTTIPFAAYALWQIIVLGSVPIDGDGGLTAALNRGLAATESLRNFVKNPWLSLFAEYFAFFALVTSYIGIALGLFDFLVDALAMRSKKLFIGSLIVAPSLLFAILYPKAFLVSLEISGGFGDAILSGLLPVAMVWVGRYVKKLEGPYRVFGGKKMLVGIFGFALLVFILQLIKLF
jgi:tyrosine-specific transport protein